MPPHERQWDLPAGYDAAGNLVTLRQAADGAEARRGEHLTTEQRRALVRARWAAGEWEDLAICGEIVDLARAERELEAGSDIGRELLAISELALDLVVGQASR